MKDIFRVLSADAKKKLIKESQPQFIYPMLATLTNNYFSKDNWLYEHKWDGYRMLAYKQGENIKLLTRNLKDYTDKFPEVALDLADQKSVHNFIIDGEIVGFKDGASSFELLQRRSLNVSHEHVRFVYCIFDILYLNEYNLMNLHLIDRKKILREALSLRPFLLLTEFVIKEGLDYLKQACHLGWEGIIAKNMLSSYLHKRSTDWLKFKCHNQQELIIIGFTDPGGSRVGFGSLLLGYYEHGDLKYAGKVGTGFSDYLLIELTKILKQIQIAESPLNEHIHFIEAVHWVEPKIVAEIRFTEWTRDGRLRHPSFLGLRIDKDPAVVIREKPKL